MVPTKSTRLAPLQVASKRVMPTRRPNTQIITNADRVKRKAESPPKGSMVLKRSAFGNLTNAISKTSLINGHEKTKKLQVTKKVTIQSKVLPTVKTVAKSKNNENLPPTLEPVKKPVTRSSLRGEPVLLSQIAPKPKESLKIENHVKTRLSNESDESLYISASENLCDSLTKSTRTKVQKSPVKSQLAAEQKLEAEVPKVEFNIGDHEVPSGINDFDRENWNDVFQVSHYAMDIFNYLKEREQTFKIESYMDRQVCLNEWMRSLLVDWMVEVQESFELNHETLYLGVKLVDYYLSKVLVGKETLQLVGAAAMFIASKYDERIPPLIDDFLYICDGAYSRQELIKMEINVLKICDFNLGIPISYRFLRRYARCAKVTMPILTLARYILEYSLMDYSIVTLSDSKLAAAALYIALRMKYISGWTSTMEFYTSYKLSDFIDISIILNTILHKRPKEQLSTVRNKYSHKIFFEVAKTELISNDKLLETD